MAIMRRVVVVMMTMVSIMVVVMAMMEMLFVAVLVRVHQNARECADRRCEGRADGGAMANTNTSAQIRAA